MALYVAKNDDNERLRNEQWYPRYFGAQEVCLKNLQRKNRNVEVKMLGIKPDTHETYGKRTRLEFMCLKEDIDKSLLNGTLTVRPKFLIIALGDLAEELEWVNKKPNRVIVVCSCPSQVCTPRMTTIHAGGWRMGGVNGEEGGSVECVGCVRTGVNVH